MVWIAALALAALNTQVSQRNAVSCDLAPFIGGGSSSAGDLDSLSGLGLGCDLGLYDSGRWSIGPRVDFSEQRWTVFKKEGEATFFNTYQARSIGLGVHTAFAVDENWKLGYTLAFGFGQGQQDQNISTSTSAQNLHLSGMTQREQRHELTVSRRFSDRLSFLAGVQYDAARQTWDAKNGRLELENVAPGNKLTLTSGTGADLDTSSDQSADYKAISFKIGVQMRLYSGLFN